MVTRPALLVADEPTGNLERRQARRVLALLREMHRLGTTVVVATHDEDLVARFPALACCCATAACRTRTARAGWMRPAD